ncbi:MAG: T9SS type A sorting domain-containing protein [Flavobacteriaceae bacterium]
MKTLQCIFSVIMLTVSVTSLGQPSHYIYVSDAGNFTISTSQILRYDLDGSNPQTFISSDTFITNNIGWPQDILFLENQGIVLVSCLIGNKITIHDANNGDYLGDFAAVAGGPTRMKIGPDEKIYVVQWSTTDNKVLRFEQDGTPLGEYTDIGVPRSVGLDFDGAGNMYVGSYGGNTVTKFDSAGISQGVLINTELSGPTNVMIEQGGTLLVLNWNGGNIKRFNASGVFMETFTTAVTQPEGITTHPVSSNYVVGNGGSAQIDEFAPNGTFVGTIVSSGLGGLIQPNAVVIRDASLAVKDFKKNKLLVTPTIGSLFLLNTTETKSLDSLEVFTLMGQKVASVSLLQEQWNADFLTEGVYVLVAKVNTTQYVQKIIVKK